MRLQLSHACPLLICSAPSADIGGSVRSPAAACGLYSLRPTAYRVPYGGIHAACNGAEGVISVAGPLARSVRDVKLFMSTILSAQPWLEDPLVVPIPWRAVDETRKLRMGYMMHDGNVQLQLPLRLALEKVVNTLRQHGAEVGIELVEYKPWQHKEGLDIVRSLYFTDGGKDVRSAHCLISCALSCGSRSYQISSRLMANRLNR